MEAARQGAAFVGVADIDAAAAEETAAAVREEGAAARAIAVDLADAARIPAMVEAAASAAAGSTRWSTTPVCWTARSPRAPRS